MALNTVLKTADVVKGECLWANGDVFFAYGGDTGGPGGPADIPGNDLWQFTPNRNAGSWSKVPLALEAQNFTSLSRTNSHACASGRGLGFIFGGITAASNDNDDIATPGMVVYNSTSQLWSNVSGFAKPGTYSLGKMHFVPSFGPEGLVVVIAGATPREGSGDRVLLSTDAVSVYEPVSQRWRTQAVTGTSPEPRVNFCVAGAHGDNDTYEVTVSHQDKEQQLIKLSKIFLYGGSLDSGRTDIPSTATSVELGSVYVLSLPSFNWQKADFYPQFGRWGHACTVVGRQMISVGGVVMTQDGADSDSADGDDDISIYEHSVPDPWSQGIGIWDLSAMAWKDRYDPAAGPYTTPQMVKQYYASNPRYPPSFTDDPVLRSWFVRGMCEPCPHAHLLVYRCPYARAGDECRKSLLNTEDNTTSPQPSSTPKSVNHKSNTGAVAGGVVGGVIGLAVVAGATWWFLRRKSKSKHSSAEYRKSELENTNHNFDARQPPKEIHAHDLHEMESSRLHEMDSRRLHEMEASKPLRNQNQ